MKNSLLLLGVVVLASCKKQNDNTRDTELPVINMSSPTQNQVFSAVQTVNIIGVITDNNKLKEVHLEIINAGTGGFVLHEHFGADAVSYNLSRIFFTEAATSYKVKGIAEDRAGNMVKTEINISSN